MQNEKRDDGEFVQERIELSQEPTGPSSNQEGEDRLDRQKVFSFNELGVHSQVRQRLQQHMDGTERRK